MNRVEQQSAFILKSQAFNESSSIHQLFTRDYGVISVISKGSKAKKSKQGSLLQPFNALIVSWLGKSELKTLISVEQDEYIPNLSGTCLFCGFYINELILCLLHKHDVHPRLFDLFKTVLKQLSAADRVEINLRKFEKDLLEEIGYGLVLNVEAQSDVPVQTHKLYYYQAEHGVVDAHNKRSEKAYSGGMLLNLHNNTLSDKVELREAKSLMRSLIDYQLAGKVLKSRELFRQTKRITKQHEK